MIGSFEFYIRSTGELIPYFFQMQVNEDIAPELVLQLQKRHRIYVTGKLQYEPVHDSNDEQRLASTILVDQICKGRLSEKNSIQFDESAIE